MILFNIFHLVKSGLRGRILTKLSEFGKIKRIQWYEQGVPDMNSLIKKSFIACTFLSASLAYTVSYAVDNALPKFKCTLTDHELSGNRPGNSMSTFTKTTPVIYLICKSHDVEQGQTIKAVWIAVDTNNVSPANYKIAEKSTQPPNNVANFRTYTASFYLSKPTNGWPIGTYDVDLYVDNLIVQSVKFNVQ
jgi:hypothetical protein